MKKKINACINILTISTITHVNNYTFAKPSSFYIGKPAKGLWNFRGVYVYVRKIMSYKKLEIWQRARSLAIDIHKLSLELPKFELYEEGSQIRRSIKSVRSNIVEGYGRKRYRADYIRFLTYALSSNDETIDHLEILFETQSFKDVKRYENLHERLRRLGIKINNYITAVEKNYRSSQGV